MRIVVIAVPVLIISAVIVGVIIGVCVLVFVHQKKRKSEYDVHVSNWKLSFTNYSQYSYTFFMSVSLGSTDQS